jgi:exodeoxyribonuclease I
MSAHTFLWHDYETFGVNPRLDRPAQFAAVRTDADLNEIGDPLMLYCQPANDFLPDPQSCLVTGITPQHCLAHGVPEYAFAAQIEQAFSQPGTIGVGYNTIRFDDEFTRFMFWRNLIDPYAREWQNNCGRWDILDVVRTAYALRPEGINWPIKPEGGASFKLTDLTAANGLTHASAHDALSDVRATIALARLLRDKQPRLFDFCLGLHKKDRVAHELGLPTTAAAAKPFLHISGMFSAERGCLAVMWPLAIHPTNKNELIAWDLAHDPAELTQCTTDVLRQRLFTRADSLPAGMSRLPIKTLHLNKSPSVIGNLKTLSPAMAQQWGVNWDTIHAHADRARLLPDLSGVWAELFKRPVEPQAASPDVDEDLYGGFIGPNDRRKLNQLRTLSPDKLATARTGFEDSRLQELVWRYRARNFPESLSPDEQQQWATYRHERLLNGHMSGQRKSRTVDQLTTEIDTLSETADDAAQDILGALYDYLEMIAP